MAISRSFKWLVAIGVIAVVALLWCAYFFYNLSPLAAGTADLDGSLTPAATTTVPIVVEKGTGFRTVTQEIARAGLIRSESSFKLYAILSGSAHQFKPGLYSFSAASSSIEMIRALVAGPSKEITILIPEGQTLAQIDDTLSRFGVIKKGSLLKADVKDFINDYVFLKDSVSLEGYLFPDTYRFYFGSAVSDVVKIMLNNFSAKVGPLVSDEGVAQYQQIPVLRRGIFSMPQIITIASIIEDEVPSSADRKIVADVLYRRLKIGMPLQVDASVLYAENVGDERYDTYKHPGLPRGPIANPGTDAIESALSPKSSNYLYYLSDPKTGKTIFAQTFEEHRENKLKYLGR
jgi:UPF0755 protein